MKGRTDLSVPFGKVGTVLLILDADFGVSGLRSTRSCVCWGGWSRGRQIRFWGS